MNKILMFAPLLAMASSSLIGSSKSIDVNLIEYDIHPIVHNIEYGDELINIPSKVQITTTEGIDSYTLDEAYNVLSYKSVIASTRESFAPYHLNLTINNDFNNTHFDKLDAYTLDITNDSISIIGKDTDSVFYGLQTLREIFRQSESYVRELTIADYSSSIYRGVIEGLYGVPWNNFEIIDMIDFISYYKANTFFYGPRHDSYFRTAWRDPLPKDELIMLEEIVEHSKTRKVDFYFGVNPVETKSFTRENYNSDLNVMLTKFEQAYSVGVRNFFISADDVMGETVDNELHLLFMNDLASWVKDKGDCGRLVLTPSCYCGNGDTRLGVNPTYLDIFNGQLDEIVDIFWTGYEVTSSVSTGDFGTFYNHAGRKPIFWLNWPVNDYAPRRIIMSKAEMLDVTYQNEDEIPFLGVISNPLTIAYPSHLSIYQVLDYAWNVRDYDVDAVYDSLFERVEENNPVELKQVVSYLANATKYLEDRYFEESPLLAMLIEQYKNKKQLGESLSEIKDEIKAELNYTIDCVDALIDSSDNENLIEQLSPYILAVKDTCLATIEYLDLEDMVLIEDREHIETKLKDASDAYDKISTNQAIVLDYVTCDETLEPVEVCNAVLTPFLNELATSLDYDARLLAGLPTGIIYRGVEGIYSGTFDDMFDDNEETQLWLNGYPQKDSFVQIDLEEVTELTSLDVVYKNMHGEYCYYPAIEISSDGKEFIKLASVSSNEITLDLRGQDVNARFIRLSNDKGAPLEWWVSIAEVKINKIPLDKPIVSLSGINGIYEGTTDLMFDGDETTYCWFNEYPEAGAYILIDYYKTIEMNDLSILFLDGHGPSNPCNMPQISYSMDGISYTKLADITSNEFTYIATEPISFRYLKLHNESDSSLGVWVSVAEVKINSLPASMTYEGFNGIYSGDTSLVFDNDDSTFVWFSSGPSANAYISFAYKEVQEASSFRIFFSNGNGDFDPNQMGLTYCGLNTLEVSLSGEENSWTILEGENPDNLIEVNLNSPIQFKYLRLRNNGEGHSYWVSLATIDIL